MPAGNYYIGDLCYVLSSRWDQVVDLMFPDRNGSGIQGQHTLSDDTVLCTFSTTYGDGEYFDGESKSYGVDSGTIGCVLTSCVDSDSDVNDGNVYEFTEPFECANEGGILYFGRVRIDTAQSEDSDDYDEDDYDDGDDD